jgi:hypothetical protein
MTFRSLQIRPQICVTNLRTKSLSFGTGAGRSGSLPNGTRELRAGDRLSKSCSGICR